MGETYTATSKAADAPDIEGGMYDARFDGTSRKRIKGGQYTKDTVNGDERLEWAFTLLDDEGAVLYDGGDPVEVTKLTGMGFNIVSKTVPAEVRILKALCTAEEFQAFLDGKGTKEADLLGRKVQVEIIIKDTGWPGVSNVIAARSKRKGKAKTVEVVADAEDEDDE